jgi:hypothetical protein
VESYFFDTNVIISYYFLWEPQHENVKRFIESNNPKYYSQTVKGESEKKSSEIQKNFSDFINLLLNELRKSKKTSKNYELMNKSSFKSLLTNFKKFDFNENQIIDLIWEKSNEYYENKINIDKIINNVQEVKNYFLQIFYKSKTYCNEKLIIHTMEKRDEELEKNIRNLLHELDLTIFLEAHDLALNKPIKNLCFVSANKGFIDNSEVLIDNSKVYKIINSGKFIFN